MKLHKLLLVLFTLIGVSSCVEPEYPDDERFQPWRIGAAIPYGYVSTVIDAYGVNETEDWTSMMLPYGNLVSSSRLNMSNIKDNLDADYDGYGLPLHSLSNFTPNQIGLGRKSIPERLYMVWYSAFDTTEYATAINITPQIKAAILKPYPHTWLEGQNCYQTNFMFGLLPNGQVKLWLEGCNIYTYVGEFEPEKVMPNPTPYKTKDENPAFRLAKKEHIEIEPIPWDKVDRVWYNKNKFRMQNIDDVIN